MLRPVADLLHLSQDSIALSLSSSRDPGGADMTGLFFAPPDVDGSCSSVFLGEARHNFCCPLSLSRDVRGNSWMEVSE